MSDTDPGRPRRALEPSDGKKAPDAAGTGDATGEAGPSRAWAAADASGQSAADAAAPEQPEVTTPIPPPAPALPESNQPPSSGRRFSAEDLGDDWVSPEPRRSALSAFSPLEHEPDAAKAEGVEPTDEPADDQAADAEPPSDQPNDAATTDEAPTDESAGDQPNDESTDAGSTDEEPTDTGSTDAGSTDAGSTDEEPTDTEPSNDELASATVAASGAGVASPPGRRRTLAWVLGGVAALLIVGLVVWLGTQRSGTTALPPAGESPSAGPSESASADPAAALTDAQLIAPTELGALRKKTTWTAQDPAATGGSVQPTCIELSTTGGAAPQAELNRRLTANKGGGTLLQIVQAWPDAAAAATALTAFATQAASCQDALIEGTYRVSGLADSATAITVQAADGTRHTLLLSNTGRFVSVVDAALPRGAGAPPAASAVVTAATPSQSRQCAPAAGACPAKAKVTAITPPATETVGWLAWVDLPRVTAGAGAWTATDPQEPKLVGSQCENVDLNKLSGTTSAAHRTYLLTDDPKAPQGFGIDEAIYGFAKAADARATAKKLNANFASCGERTRTATVKDAAVTAPGADGKDLKATSYLVTQRISESRTVTFRVGIATIGGRVIYLMANPSANFDFSDAAWKRIVGRATQRATQFA